jgi:hypothetical protein
MKIKNKRKIIIIVLFLAFIVLSISNYYVIRINNDLKSSFNTNNTKKQTDHIYIKFNYSDIFKSIEICSPKFILVKIEKNTDNKNFINVEISYKGEMEGLIKGLKIMKMQDITKNINEININKSDNKEYIAEINVDFFKFN